MSTKPNQSKNISKEIIGAYLPPQPIIVEAGAHIGRDTRKMLRHWPDATVHVFEPVPELYEELTKNTQALKSVHRYPYALNSHTGKQLFYVSSGRSTATSSLFKPSGYLHEHPQTVFTPQYVETITLDIWAERYAIPKVDALWLDMQGGELEALKGAEKLLLSVRIIYTEVSLHERYEKTPLYPEIRTWLEYRGFRIVHEALGEHWGNVLFIRA